MNLRILSVLATAVMMALTSPAWAQGWGRTRDSVMDLRESRDFQGAYALASRFSPSNAGDAYDAEFVSGWIALRYLNRPDLAMTHFARMAAKAPDLRPNMRNVGRAQAGYWLGRALVMQGRAADAKTLFKAAAAYPNTFYGQLSSAELKVSLSKSAVAGVASNYPTREFKWHDARAKRELVLAIIREESAFRQSAVSNKGAGGLMQVMPGTAKHIGRSAGVSIDPRMMSTNPDYNVAVGSKYLADQIERYRGNAMLAAAAYNAGPQRVDEWLQRFGDPRGGVADPIDWIESIPFRETRDYVKKVIGSYVTYMTLAQGN